MTDPHDTALSDPDAAEVCTSPRPASAAPASWPLVGTIASMAVAALLLIQALADPALNAGARPGWLLAVLMVQLLLVLALWQRWDLHRAAGDLAVMPPDAQAPAGTDAAAQSPSIATELEQLRAANRELHRRAMYDGLTELPNRALFEELVDAELALSRRQDRRLALMFVDLDRFKAVNDALGHAAGDELLQGVTRRMREVLRESDVACRLAGDEFVILLRDAGSREELAALCERLLANLARPYARRSGALTVTASAGLACYPHDGADVQSLLAAADAAMYEAKHAGRNQWRFHSIGAEAYDALPPGPRRLAQALLRNELVLHYQPVCRGDGAIVGAEALARWPMDGGRLVGAGDFIAMAERSGLITDLGDWTLRQACRQLARWRAEGHALQLAINVSALELRDVSLPDRVAEALHEGGLPADALELEITETALMQDSDASRHLIDRLHDLGVRLTIDDFGVGYSSLAQLRQLRPGRIKIDRSFVSACDQDNDSCTLLAALIAMARSLRIEVVAEGVETPAQRAFLLAQGCDLMQGHGLARPMAADDLGRMLRRNARLALQAA